MAKYRLAISGSYGGMNLGDEAILEAILKEIRSSLDAEIVVFSFNAKDTEKRHNVRAIPFREMHKDEIIEELKTIDLFILGGGGILFDEKAEVFLRDVTWAKEQDIPVMTYAISVGPLKQAESKQRVVEVLNKVDLITVRENESKKILNDIGVTKSIEVTADPAFLIEPQNFSDEMLSKEGIDTKVPIVGISIREPGPAAPNLSIDHYHAMLANAADFMIDRFEAQVLFVPLEPIPDSQHAHAVISKMLNPQKAAVLKGEYMPSQLLGLVKKMEFIVGMRLHFLIFAALQNIPFIPLPYASKIKGFLESLEIPSPPIEEWNTGRLCALLDKGWDNRKSFYKKFERHVPELRSEAKRTTELLCEFLHSLHIKG